VFLHLQSDQQCNFRNTKREGAKYHRASVILCIVTDCDAALLRLCHDNFWGLNFPEPGAFRSLLFNGAEKAKASMEV
jgi:hypothetical protein